MGVLVISAFHMRFPRDEWNNALTYYRPMSKTITNQIESYETVMDKKYNDEEKENLSHLINNEIQS
jgi:hypothetical protein